MCYIKNHCHLVGTFPLSEVKGCTGGLAGEGVCNGNKKSINKLMVRRKKPMSVLTSSGVSHISYNSFIVSDRSFVFNFCVWLLPKK